MLMPTDVSLWVTWKKLVARPFKILVPVYQSTDHKISFFIRNDVETPHIQQPTLIFAAALVSNTVFREIMTTRPTYSLFWLSRGRRIKVCGPRWSNEVSIQANLTHSHTRQDSQSMWPMSLVTSVSSDVLAWDLADPASRPYLICYTNS